MVSKTVLNQWLPSTFTLQLTWCFSFRFSLQQKHPRRVTQRKTGTRPPCLSPKALFSPAPHSARPCPPAASGQIAPRRVEILEASALGALRRIGALLPADLVVPRGSSPRLDAPRPRRGASGFPRIFSDWSPGSENRTGGRNCCFFGGRGVCENQLRNG